ncbi:TonB-dependent receptor [Pelagibacteraceae bacterium]|nr:TonB-dependent receptor [Pelagibacteraceae bacterium]
MRVIYFFIIILLFKPLLSAENELGTVLVSPNKSLIELDKVGSSVFYIDKEDIEKSSATTSTGLLQEFGGFTVAPKGSKGSDPGYYNRGLSRRYIKVLVDGMNLSDITSTQEEVTFIDNISMFNIENIELLNGSQGTLYGGNAIGGVISINSLLPDKYGLTQENYIEGGSYGTVKNSNSVKFLNKDYSFVFNLDGERSSGYHSFTDTGLAPTEKDGYYLYGTNFLSNFKIKNNIELNINGRYYKQRNQYDDNYSYPGDTDTYLRNDKVAALLLDISYTAGNTSHKLTFQPTYTTRINEGYSKSEFDGRKNKVEYLISEISENISGLSTLYGIDYLEKIANMNGTLANKHVYSFFSEFRIKPTINSHIDLSIRREIDSEYGGFDTGRFQVNHTFFKNIILRSSIGTGYRTPTPYELFSSYGNTNLTPEKSITYDLGSEINFREGATNLYLGFFETKVEDLISYVSSKYRQSINNLKTNGLEARVKTKIYKNIETGISYTKTNGKENDGDSLTLIPKDKLMLSLNISPTDSINLNTYYQFHNKAKDNKYNELPTYRSLNFKANYLFNNNSKAFLKIENLLDRDNIVNRGGGTSENLGYRSPDLSLFLGLKFKH